MTILVMVADSGKARLLSAQSGGSDLEETGDIIHSQSRLKQQDLVSDSSGNQSGVYGQHSMGHEKDAHQHQAQDFAKELCAELDKVREQEGIHRIYLVASPKFLGFLRSCMSKQSAALVQGEIDKDLVNHSVSDIRTHLPQYL